MFDGYAQHERCTAARGHPVIPWPNRLRDAVYDFHGQPHRLAD